MISRAELEAEIGWRVWWERFRNYLLLTGAAADWPGNLPSDGVQSSKNGVMISVLSLVVAILAVFFGPLIAQANVQRQIRATARETWMREFRQHAAELLKNHGSMPSDAARAFEFRVAMRLSYNALRLLVAERAPQYDGFISHLDDMMRYQGDFGDQFTAAAADILQRERAAIMEDPRVWREIWISLGFGAAGWRPWTRLRAWLRRDPPRFPDLP
jgi:hypothetical protein